MIHPQQTHVFEDGASLRMMGNSVLVKIDATPDKSASGLIHYAPNAMEHVNNTGTILAYGTRDLKKGRVPLFDENLVGKKCVFVRFLAEQDSNKQMRQRISEDFIRIKATDIIVVYDPEDQGRFS